MWVSSPLSGSAHLPTLLPYNPFSSFLLRVLLLPILVCIVAALPVPGTYLREAFSTEEGRTHRRPCCYARAHFFVSHIYPEKVGTKFTLNSFFSIVILVALGRRYNKDGHGAKRLCLGLPRLN